MDYAALVREADRRARVGRNSRGKGHVLADTLIERVTGQGAAADVPVAVEIGMPAETLLGEADTPAHLVGYGPLPAAHVRRFLRDSEAAAWVRRPLRAARLRSARGDGLAPTAVRRSAPSLRGRCATSSAGCRGATPRIRHVDHPVPHRSDGSTRGDNAHRALRGLQRRQGGRRLARPAGAVQEGRHLLTVTTPTRHRFTSAAPDPPGASPGPARAMAAAGARGVVGSSPEPAESA